MNIDEHVILVQGRDFPLMFRRNVTAAPSNALDSQPSVQPVPATPPAEGKDGNKLHVTLMGVGFLLSSHIIGFMFETVYSSRDRN